MTREPLHTRRHNAINCIVGEAAKCAQKDAEMAVRGAMDTAQSLQDPSKISATQVYDDAYTTYMTAIHTAIGEFI